MPGELFDHHSFGGAFSLGASEQRPVVLLSNAAPRDSSQRPPLEERPDPKSDCAQAETLRSRVNRRVVSGSTVAPHGFKKSRSKLLAGEGQDRGSLTLQSVGQSPSPCITGSDS